MKGQKLKDARAQYLRENCTYRLLYYKEFNFELLKKIIYRGRRGRGKRATYNDIIIMADTETSKKRSTNHNIVVAWSMSLRAFGMNLVTLYGHSPSEFTDCLQLMRNNLKGDEIFIYWHNMSYDWTFIRKFMFRDFGYPKEQLNTKSHYPIRIEFENGIIFKDSLILAQRSLEKWAKDLGAEHQKSCGKWDYDKYRTQHDAFSDDELEYIEHDVLAGVECIDLTLQALHKDIASIPYTATGIPRAEIRQRGQINNAREWFKKVAPDYEQYCISEYVFHGGYVHANRWLVDHLITKEVQCYDFSSSYPYCLLAYKMPGEHFVPISDQGFDYIIKYADDYAFMYKLILLNVRLKDMKNPMPALQRSKCIRTINTDLDNGRILSADYVEIYLTELDGLIINEMYDWDQCICTDIQQAKKDYLPRWIRDYVYECYEDKCKLKGGDPVLYALAKAKLNSLYGMFCQRCIRDEIKEDYEQGLYIQEPVDREEYYAKYLKKYTSILPYYVGCWVTSAAFYNLFQLAKCTGTFVYSDTDSVYGYDWNYDQVHAYNEGVKKKMRAAGYGPVIIEGREFWPGIAESDGDNDKYTEFKVLGAKRYCGRCKADGELHITVAGVPKKNGAKCLHNDINEFTKGKVFDGITTGKKTHEYIYIDQIYVDEYGETGDSIDLYPCDYLLDAVFCPSMNDEDEEVTIQIYEEKDIL